MAKNKLKVAVIGAGNMGKNHVRVYSELPNCQLVAICDINEDLARQFGEKYRCNYYQDFRQMLDSEELDAVSVVVPTKSHKAIAVEILKRKINCLVEKPIAFNIAEGQAIISAARASGALLSVGHIERFNPAVAKLLDLVEDGVLGSIISIEAQRVGPYVPKNRDTGVLIDLAVHDIDIINHLLKSGPQKVYSKGGRIVDEIFEDHAEIFLDYGKTSGYVQVNWITPLKIRRLRVTGSKGYAELDYITQKLFVCDTYYKVNVKKIGKEKLDTSGQREIPIKFREPIKEELKSFLDCVLKNKKPMVSGEEGLLALDITLKALKRMR
ncbi:MAG: Gfo/Idh/MocA family oxidoreductase [Candidatus Paceibacterota bacterium]